MIAALLDLKLGIPEFDTPAGVADQWQEGFKTNAQRINKKRVARVGTPESFAQVLVAPAAAGYGPYLSSSFTSRKGRSGTQSKNSQRQNLARSFNKYDSKTRAAYAIPPAGGQCRFADQVDQAKGSFALGNSARTLRITGCRESGLGVAGLLGMFLTDDNQSGSYLRGCDDLLAGSPIPFSLRSNRSAFKVALSCVLTYTGVEWIKNDFRASMADALNIILSSMISRFCNVAVYDPPQEELVIDRSWVGWQHDSKLGPILRISIYPKYVPPPITTDIAGSTGDGYIRKTETWSGVQPDDPPTQ
jgi:hypothetical protein